MKTPYITIVLILILLAGIGYYYTIVPITQGKSTLIIAVKDASKQSNFGTISSLVLTFSEVSVHKASADETINTSTGDMIAIESNETGDGWIKVVDEIQAVDLLQFTDVSKILGQETLDAGKYNQLRLKIDSGTVTISGNTYNLTIPSGVLKLNRGFELETNAELKLTLDFKAEKSLVETGNNKFKLKPVIAVISEEKTTTKPLTTSPITTTPSVTTAPATTAPKTTTITSTTTPTTTSGILLMKIKDKLDLTNITAVQITVSKVEVHKADDGNDTNSNETFETNDTSSAGWITIVDSTKTYNLIELANKPGEAMGNKTLSAGKYTQIRLYISKAELILNNITYDVKIPSNRFYWIHPFYIESGKLTTLTLDFDAADSIKETGNNKFILKPVVKILSEVTTTTSTTSTTTTSTSSTTSTTLETTTTSTTTSSTTTTIPIETTTTSTTTLETTTSTIPETTTTTITI